MFPSFLNRYASFPMDVVLPIPEYTVRYTLCTHLYRHLYIHIHTYTYVCTYIPLAPMMKSTVGVPASANVKAWDSPEAGVRD